MREKHEAQLLWKEIPMRAQRSGKRGEKAIDCRAGTWGRVGLCLCGLLLAGIGGRWAVAAGQPTYHLLKQTKTGGEGGWDYLTVDPQSRRLYISRSDHVQILDVDTGSKVGEIANTPGVHGIALAPRLGRGFTSNGREGTVTIFDLKSLKELGRPKVGTGPDAILFDPASKRVFTFNGRSQDATAIDAASGQVAGTIALGGKPEFAVSDGKGEIFVNIEDKSELLALDPRHLTVLHRWPLAPGEEPSGLALDRAHRRLFAVCGNQKMVVVDADSGKVVATPPIGRGPDACTFDPKTGRAFSSNGRDGTLTVIHEDGPDRFSEVATVPTQVGARTMAIDEKTGRIILVTAEVAPTPAGTEAPRRRSFVPGSFTVLVVGE
jgi:DNA-binding beta-propeller fold protein YncE